MLHTERAPPLLCYSANRPGDANRRVTAIEKTSRMPLQYARLSFLSFIPILTICTHVALRRQAFEVCGAAGGILANVGDGVCEAGEFHMLPRVAHCDVFVRFVLYGLSRCYRLFLSKSDLCFLRAVLCARSSFVVLFCL